MKSMWVRQFLAFGKRDAHEIYSDNVCLKKLKRVQNDGYFHIVALYHGRLP